MQLTGEHTIAASPEAVYDAMLDPEVLRNALPGCEKLEETGENEYLATMTIGIGMIKGKYNGSVRITDQNRPENFRMHIEGKGPQGQLSGDGTISFAPNDEGGTIVSYVGDANLRGVLARIGGRVVQPAARMIVGKFFESLETQVTR